MGRCTRDKRLDHATNEWAAEYSSTYPSTQMPWWQENMRVGGVAANALAGNTYRYFNCFSEPSELGSGPDN
jgi:hypothetical protein